MARRLAFLVVLVIAFPMPGLGAGVGEHMQVILQQPAKLDEVVDDAALYFPKQLGALYKARKGAPGWVTESMPLSRSEDMLEALQESHRDGLFPDDYHAHQIGELLDALHADHGFDERRKRRLAALELLLSDAFVLLGEHESGGRLKQEGLHPRVDADRNFPSVVAGLRAVFAGAQPRAELDRLLPHGNGYGLMREALDRYRQIEAQGGFVHTGHGPLLVRGSKGRRVSLLIDRLHMSEDLPRTAGFVGYFDQQVEDAVRRFQARHGLAADGVVGPETLEALDTPVSTWINRIEVNLERRRWLPGELGARRLVVNIADFHATLYDHDQPVLSEPVIVGQSVQQTPELSNQIRYLVVNPAWDVPARIAVEEILPAVQRDPGYLRRNGLEVLSDWGAQEHAVDPRRVRWKRWTSGTLPYHFRQRPGPGNSLGWVKFMFPNVLDIYLHDTPAQGLFDQNQRTFSHGCIRVAHALKLAATMLALEGREDAGSSLLAMVSAGQTQRIDLAEPIPIYITYMSVWIDETGMLQFRPDVYDRDMDVLNGLYSPLRKNP